MSVYLDLCEKSQSLWSSFLDIRSITKGNFLKVICRTKQNLISKLISKKRVNQARSRNKSNIVKKSVFIFSVRSPHTQKATDW